MKNGWKETCLNCKECDEEEWICKKDDSILPNDLFQERTCCELKYQFSGPLFTQSEEKK
jgi:hypothetical protein